MTLQQGDTIELKVTPDPYVTVRYAGASGDFNPIHIDEDFAQKVGLPGRILHGLWTMAQVARAMQQAAGGDPRKLRRLSVQFRGMGFPEQEIVVTGSVRESGEATEARTATDRRRAAYLRDQGYDPAAGREARVFGLSNWFNTRAHDAWLAALEPIWRDRTGTRTTSSSPATPRPRSPSWTRPAGRASATPP